MDHATDHCDWADRLTGLVHDLWFSVDDVYIRRGEGCVMIPLRPSPDALPRMQLVVPGANAVCIRDTEHIGVYDINYVCIKHTERILSLYGNIPIQIDIQTDDPCAAYVEDI